MAAQEKIRLDQRVLKGRVHRDRRGRRRGRGSNAESIVISDDGKMNEEAKSYC
jgi:hypothetical protein